MTKHTPGPWTWILGVASQHPAVYGANGEYIAEVYKNYPHNAALIAAAPSLVTALELCLLILRNIKKEDADLGMPWSDECGPNDALTKGKAALDKVKP